MSRASITEEELADLHSSAQDLADQRARRKHPGAILGLLALAVGWLWVFGAAAAIFTLMGASQLVSASPILLGALLAGILLPAFMVWFAGAAAQEAARARADAGRLADAADTLINPAPGAEAAARRLAVAVRGEISALDRAIDGALSKLQSVDSLVQDHARRVHETAALAHEGAGAMISGLDNERETLIRMTRELEAQVNAIGDAINRHTRLIADAARTAEAGVRAADETLDARLSSFGAAAALISDRTRALSAAAKESGDSANRLETALHGALDVLAKATTLTDAARQSADEATFAANATAGAVRETTSRAVEEARRAAEHIRSQTSERRTSAEPPRQADRAAYAPSPAAAPPPAPRSRWSNLFAPKDRNADRVPAPPPAAAPQTQPDRFGERAAARHQEPAPQKPPQEPDNVRPLFAGDQRPSRSTRFDTDPRERRERQADAQPAPARASGGEDLSGGRWTWKDLLAKVDAAEPDAVAARRQPAASEPEPEPEYQRRAAPRFSAQGASAAPAARQAPLEDDAVSRLSRSVAAPARPNDQLPAVAVVESAGVRIAEVFSIAALDRIAHRARNGTQARRRAVKDAAGEAVTRLGAFLAHDAEARQEAAGFLNREGARIAELLGRGRASMSSEATRAFLLLDAAVG